jgi:hypothetical protein
MDCGLTSLLSVDQVVVESGDGRGGDYYSLRVVRDDHFVLGLAALEVGFDHFYLEM